MKYTTKKLSETKTQTTVTLDKKDLAEAKELALVRLAQEVKAPGFRKGKVPPSVAEKHVSAEMLTNEILDRAINKAIVEVYTKEGTQVLDRPQVDVKKFVPDESLEFSAEAEVLPEITLGDYKKLKVTKPKITVAKKDIDEVLERMQLNFAEKKEVNRAAKNKDEVFIDFHGTDKDGKDIPGASGKDYPLSLGSNTFIPGFEEGLIGKKVGDEFNLPLTFPKEYHASHLAGAKVNFAVKVKKVNEVVLPKVDDAFAAKCGPFKNVAELTDDIKKELTARKTEEADNKLKDELVEKLVKASKVPVPEVLVSDQARNLEQDMVQNLMARGVTLEQYLTEKGFKDKEEWQEKELKEAAVARVQSGLVLAELTKAEKIEADKKELDERHAQMMAQYAGDANIRAQLDTPEARRDLANRVLTEKTIQRLLELNVK
ncbi:trigger factor [Candidatus Saccharibacteria bacterium]|nr:trigger factor [Candidatus Saccharibacteria bacterium]